MQDIVFSFYDDRLYQVVVSYARERMEGVTKDDVIESISATYRVPLSRLPSTARSALPADTPEDRAVVARWEDAASVLTLTRGGYSPDFQLVLISKTLNPRARGAIREALRLDMLEAPRRERDERKKEAADASLARQRARMLNKAAFRP